MKRRFQALAATVVAVLPATLAVAGSGMVTPPMTVRTAAQFVSAASLSNEAGVWTFVSVRGQEYRSREWEPNGTYVEASEQINYSDHYTQRTITCVVDPSSMKVWTNGATLQAILDPQSVNCTQEGWSVDSSGDATPYRFESPVSVQGTWSDPKYERSSIANTSETNMVNGGVTRLHCKSVEAWEAKGSFVVNDVVYPFGVQASDAVGTFRHEACNHQNPVTE